MKLLPSLLAITGLILSILPSMDIRAGGIKDGNRIAETRSGSIFLTSGALLKKPDEQTFWMGRILPEEWLYHVGDNPNFARADFDDSRWRTQNVLLPLDDIPADDMNNILWFRLHITIDSTLHNRDIALILFQQGASEVYLNGRLLQSLGTVSTDTQLEKRYNPTIRPIALHFSGQSEYVLAIRYSNVQAPAMYNALNKPRFLRFAGIEAGVKHLQEAVNDANSVAQYYSFTNLIASGVLAALTVLHFFLYIFYPRYKVNLFYCLFTAVLVFRFLVSYYFEMGSNPTLYVYFFLSQYVYTTLFTVFYLAFLYSLFYPTMPRRIWVIAGVSVVCSLLMIFYGALDISFFIWQGFMVIAALEGLRVVVFHGILQKQPGSWVLAFGVFDFVFMWTWRGGAMVSKLLGASGVFTEVPQYTQELITYTGYMSIPLAMSVYIALYFSRTHRFLAQQVQKIQELSDRTIEQERLAHEQAIRQKLLEVDNDRKTKELEEARELQLSMLPKVVPQHPGFDIAAYMQTATEVGGDYYDFKILPDGTLIAAVGDATGHGMKAGFLVSATKSYVQTLGKQDNSAELLEKISRGIRNMNLRGMYMCLAILKFIQNQVTIAVAGMPPVLIFRAKTSTVDRVLIKALPLGSIADFPYKEHTLAVNDGDVLLIMSDGLPELFNASGDMLGYEAIEECYAKVADRSPHAIVAALLEFATSWGSGGTIHDDMTIVVIKVKPQSVKPLDSQLLNGQDASSLRAVDMPQEVVAVPGKQPEVVIRHQS